MDAPIRICVTFSGRVQGVGFRYTTVGVAQGFDVTGYVRNLSDGSVEMVAEGASSEVRAFVSAVSEEMAGNIGNMNKHEAPPTGEFSEFAVRY